MQWVVLGRVRKEALSDGVSGRICVMRSASEEGKEQVRLHIRMCKRPWGWVLLVVANWWSEGTGGPRGPKGW